MAYYANYKVSNYTLGFPKYIRQGDRFKLLKEIKRRAMAARKPDKRAYWIVWDDDNEIVFYGYYSPKAKKHYKYYIYDYKDRSVKPYNKNK